MSLDRLHFFAYLEAVEIESISHKALRSFVETGNPKGLSGELVERIRRTIAFLIAAQDEEDLTVPPNFGAHRLTGDRAGTWAMTVTRNWRMTFRLNDDGAIIDLDLEDYH